MSRILYTHCFTFANVFSNWWQTECKHLKEMLPVSEITLFLHRSGAPALWSPLWPSSGLTPAGPRPFLCWGPELNAAWQVRSRESGVEWENPLPGPAGHQHVHSTKVPTSPRGPRRLGPLLPRCREAAATAPLRPPERVCRQTEQSHPDGKIRWQSFFIPVSSLSDSGR